MKDVVSRSGLMPILTGKANTPTKTATIPIPLIHVFKISLTPTRRAICQLTNEYVDQHSITGKIANQPRFSWCTSNLSRFRASLASVKADQHNINMADNRTYQSRD